jgi:hypothetical protein
MTDGRICAPSAGSYERRFVICHFGEHQARQRRLKENLVPTVRVLFILSAMTQKLRFWLLALFLATLAFTSCMNQEGVAPAEGELKTPGGAGGY